MSSIARSIKLKMTLVLKRAPTLWASIWVGAQYFTNTISYFYALYYRFCCDFFQPHVWQDTTAALVYIPAPPVHYITTQRNLAQQPVHLARGTILLEQKGLTQLHCVKVSFSVTIKCLFIILIYGLHHYHLLSHPL